MVSAPLMLMAELVIYLVAVPLGVLCAVERGRLADRLISLGLFLLYSIPPAVAGMLFLLYLCYGDYLKIFPMERLHSDGGGQLGMLRLAGRLSVARLSAGGLPVAVQPGRHCHVFPQRHARRDPSRLCPHRPGQGASRRRRDPQTRASATG